MASRYCLCPAEGDNLFGVSGAVAGRVAASAAVPAAVDAVGPVTTVAAECGTRRGGVGDERGAAVSALRAMRGREDAGGVPAVAADGVSGSGVDRLAATAAVPAAAGSDAADTASAAEGVAGSGVGRLPAGPAVAAVLGGPIAAGSAGPAGSGTNT